MPRKETILDLFLASPSDLDEEREIVLKVVNEFNKTWRKSTGRSFELLKWETDALPGVGIDPQDVINQSIGNEYDIFVGIMWTRFGTPTKRVDSGTEEEFIRAYERFARDSKYPRILFYFKTAGVDLNDLDLEQLAKVKKFKSKIGNKGTLYWDFESPEQFEGLIRMHLAKVVQTLDTDTEASSPDCVPVSKNPTPEELKQEEESELEEGFLDAVIDGQEHLEASTESMGRMTAAMEMLADETGKRTQELKSLGEVDTSQKMKDAKRISNHCAEDLEEYTKRIRTELPILSKRFQSGIRSFTTAASLFEDFRTNDTEGLMQFRDALNSNSANILTLSGQLNTFTDTIDSLPRLTTRFNRAKKMAVKEHQNLDTELQNFLTLIVEAVKLLDSVVEKQE